MRDTRMLRQLRRIGEKLEVLVDEVAAMSDWIYSDLEDNDDGPFVVVHIGIKLENIKYGVSKNPTDAFPPFMFRNPEDAYRKMLELNARIREEE